MILYFIIFTWNSIKYSYLRALLASTQLGRPGDQADGRHTSTTLWTVSGSYLVYIFLAEMHTKWSPIWINLLFLSVLSDKAKQSNEFETIMQRKHHLFTS